MVMVEALPDVAPAVKLTAGPDIAKDGGGALTVTVLDPVAAPYRAEPLESGV
jgi:hypothetical protein